MMKWGIYVNLKKKKSFLILIILATIIIVGVIAVNFKQGAFAADDKSVLNIPPEQEDITVPVLGYHSIANDEIGKNPIIIGKKRFRDHMKAIKESGYTTITVGDLDDYLNNKKNLPRKSVLITFDDGYEDNYSNAYPELKSLNMKATFFVAPSLLNQQRYMSTREVKELSDNGFDIQSHTDSHVDLTSLPYDKQLEQMKHSKEEIEKITGKQVISAAYPMGLHNEDTFRAMKECNYSLGFTVNRGFVRKRCKNNLELNRVLVDYTYSDFSIKRVLFKSYILG